MARTPINVGTSPNDGTGDSIRDSFTAVNANSLLDDSLQTAVGIAEGVERVGSYSAPAEPAWEDDATVLETLKKHESRIGGTVGGARHSGAAGAIDRDLQNDYNYETATDAVIGTTFIAPDSAVGSQYPADNTVYSVRSTWSADANDNGPGYVRTVTISNGTSTWIRQRLAGTWTGFQAISGTVYTSPNMFAWMGTGPYTITILQDTHGLGTDIVVDWFEVIGGSLYRWYGETFINTSGDAVAVCSSVAAQVTLQAVIRAN